MKKFLLVLFIIILPISFTHAQGMLVFDTMLNTATVGSIIEQVIHYAQVINEYVQTAIRWEQQINQWKREAERYAKALSSFTEIRDYSSFMDWYNRSLNAERRMQNFINSPNIKIGGRSYSWYELDQIADDVSGDLHWNSEFTEAQRREMWLKMGMTPSNYAYVAPYRQRAGELTYEMLARRDLQESWFAKNLEQAYVRQTAMQNDQLADESDKLTEKELLMMINEALNEQIITTNMMAEMQAMLLEQQAIENQLNRAPQGAPPVINPTPGNVFRPLDNPLYGIEH